MAPTPPPARPLAPTVSREWIAGILAAAERSGVDRSRIAAGCGVSPAVLDAPRCPLPLCVAIWDVAARLTGDPLFGLHAGGSLLPAQFNLLSHVLAHSSDLGAALELARRYLPLVSDGGTIQAGQPEAGLLALHYLPLTHGWRYSHHQIDAALLAIVRLIDWVSGGNVAPVAITIARPPPAAADAAAYRQAFGCRVQFDAAHDAVFFPAGALGASLAADPVQAGRARDRAERALIDLRSASWSARTLRLIAAGLADGTAGRAAVAGALRVSERTLQRRLRDEGRDYAQLLVQVRRELACDYLAGGLTPAETSRLLGYSEPAAFHRAFTGWTGLTPGRYAARAARAPRDGEDPAPA